ncbi:hypothetical protein Glove_60g131 [Diversispora epigaea]|uniref:Uncharacterized protein n=1 Tax=Diversispora epigaea TaxID=1348612 RepID=A0A397JBT5_9GLOM|nr:hypothetical protein Glove_60g131 [Diversispora epigaea]
MLIFDYIRNEAIISDDFKSKHIQAIEAQVPLRVLELNNEFDLLKERYANWPQPVNRIVANNALAEFHNNISFNSLRELTCAVFSGLFSFEHLSTVSVQEICLPLLEVNKYLEKPFFLKLTLYMDTLV